LKEGLKVEIFTLPYDSINEEVQERVVQQYKELEGNGAILYFCKWNIGDPGRTSTAVGRWYSYHGKFIVTEKAAILLSANFIDMNELDAALFFKYDANRISDTNKKFDELIELFITPILGFDGSIRSKIKNTEISRRLNLFQLPKVITTDTYKDHWITDYPSELCPKEIVLNDQLYICPFDIRGMKIIQELITQSNKYLYISTESFTEEKIVGELIKKKINNNQIEICILTGSKSMDFSDRINDMFRQLLAAGIKVRTTEGALHAKLMISEKFVSVSSINLNKMNLGFDRTSHLWRENTETIAICSDMKMILNAKEQFQNVFAHNPDIAIELATKIEGEVKNILQNYYGLSSSTEAKKIFSKYILNNEIKVKIISLKIGKIAKRILALSNRNRVSKDDILKALILNILSDKKQDFSEIEEKIKYLLSNTTLSQLLNDLTLDNYIERDGDDYKVNVESLF
jgi:hypothetical protein